MVTVTFLPNYRKITVEKGSTVLDAVQRAGIHMNVVCGGQGKCGKCMVYIKNGSVSFDQEKYGKFFSEEERANGACLACMSFINDDLHVLIPESSLIQEQKILIESLGVETEFQPSVRKYYLELSPPTLEDPSADLTRLVWGIQKRGGPIADKIYSPLDIIRRMPRILRDSGWKVTATIDHVPAGYRIIDLEKGDTSKNLYGVAVDLGTTTVVAYIRDLVDGHIAGVASNYNRQISCGEDILSRVNYARRHGLQKLQSLAAESTNLAITTAANNAGIDREDIYEVIIAGNTIMTHILLGIDPAYMIEEPYVPVVRRYLTTAAPRVGIDVAKDAEVFFFPAVSDYIGGDIVADILASGMAEKDEISLMVDIGTNFEVVLGNREWMVSCAGAAGPALEGGEVLFGMRANPGAIERIAIDGATLEPVYATINNIKPLGVCGSGLVDLLAGLLKACVVDRTGRINMGIKNMRIRQGTHFPEYVIAWKTESGNGKDIVITENDIKNLIMSKASVLAACMTLMKTAGVTKNDISTIYFSGAFGNYITKENAIIIGLVPEIPVSRIKNIGNGAIEGASMALVNRKKRKMLDEIAKKISYIELNSEPSFMDEYTGSSFLPHTDLSLFPGVEKMLNECRLKKAPGEIP